MNTTRWIEHVRESFAAAAAGARAVPLGDNSELHHSLAVRLAQMRVDAALGRIPSIRTGYFSDQPYE